MSNLGPVWEHIKRALADGISVIPVHDKQQGEKAPKEPAIAWKRYQTEIITEQVLWEQMERKDTEAVAMVCGKVSGGLEVIDVDVKYETGIDAYLFDRILDMYPDLFRKLRIHKTPSGGYHLLYRIAGGDVETSRKLAGRHATEDELERAPKAKEYHFIETKGEGGLTMMPPALGYSVHQANPIPIITKEERESLIGISRAFNRIHKPMPEPRQSKSDSTYYDEVPWKHFNGSPEAEEILEKEGWLRDNHKRGPYIHYTRPGKKSGTSATFDTNTRLYYCFTTNGGLEEGRAYSPAGILCALKHSGNFSVTIQELVSKGYGRIKPQVESRIVKWKALKGAPLPANVSESAKREYDTTRARFAEDFPYGVFWERDEDGDIIISREDLYTVARGLGFRCYAEKEIVQIMGCFVFKRTVRQFMDELKTYMQDEDGDTYVDMCNSYESFMQRAGKYTSDRLDLLNTSAFLDDTRLTAYKFYNNGVVRIDDTLIELSSYESYPDRLVWAHEINDRDYPTQPPITQPLITQFLEKAVRYNHASGDYVQKIFGYLAHRYKDETTGYIIVLTEECPDPKQGGGSGKNIFSSLLSHITTLQGIPGSQMSFDERFLQPWTGERILVISDVDKNFNFVFLKEQATGKGVDKKLYQNQGVILCENMPKFIIQTNYSYEGSDGGILRRIIPLEFTGFFTKCGGVDVYFGKHFPNDWSKDDWDGYDLFMAAAIQKWIAGGLKIARRNLSEEGWAKQFRQEYGKLTFQFLEENWDSWLQRTYVPIVDFNLTYDIFCTENNVDRKFRLSSLKMNEALVSYATHRDDIFTPNELHRHMGISKKCKYFLPKTPF